MMEETVEEIQHTTLGTSPYLRWALVAHGPWEQPGVEWCAVIAPLMARGGCFTRHMRPRNEWGLPHLDWAVRAYLTGTLTMPTIERVRTWSAATWDSFEPSYTWAVRYLYQHAATYMWQVGDR